MNTTLATTSETSEDLILTWRVHLAKIYPQRSVGIVLAMGAVALMALAFFGPIGALLWTFVFCGFLSDFMLPITYTITSTRATSSTRFGKQTIAWADVKRCYVDDLGIKLSPLSRRSRLEAYRGVYLRFGDNKEELIETVKRLRPLRKKIDA